MLLGRRDFDKYVYEGVGGVIDESICCIFVLGLEYFLCFLMLLLSIKCGFIDKKVGWGLIMV